MKKAISLLIVLVLMMSVTITGFAADQASTGTITGGSTVDNVVLNVVLPTQLDFKLNPLEIGTSAVTGSQIKSTDYIIVNKTAAPVEVAYNLIAVPESDVTLVDDNSTLKPDDRSATSKDIYFAAIGATDVTVGDLAFDKTTGTSAKFDYDKDLTDTIVGLKVVTDTTSADVGKAKGTMAFALGAATGEPIDALAADDAGVASFQFCGELNTYAAWAANDVTITGSYTLTPLRSSTYDALDSDGYAENGLNQLTGSTRQISLGFYGAQADTRTATKVINVSKSTSPDLAINFNAGVSWTTGTDPIVTNSPIAKILYNVGTTAYPTGAEFVEGTYEYDEEAQTLTFYASEDDAGVGYAIESWSGGPAFFTITLKDNPNTLADESTTQYTIALNIVS